ncbi:hypothetical protein TWF718_006817 [Orbilia javanica]|uniref:Uncharacterized protein n=1 Tax=Orbilia javanica TaxID=47235 RepID=A0AAN8MSC6_9PEZI
MSQLILPSSISDAQHGHGYYASGGGGGDDPNQWNNRPGGHGGDDLYQPPIDDEGESDGSSDKEDPERSPKTPENSGKKPGKTPYNSERRTAHYKEHNIKAQRDLKLVMIDSLNRTFPRPDGSPYTESDADRTRFFNALPPSEDNPNEYEHYWRLNPYAEFNTADRVAWDKTFNKGNTASRWGYQNMNHLIGMVETNKIIPARANRPTQPPRPQQPQPDNYYPPSNTMGVPSMGIRSQRQTFPTDQAVGGNSGPVLGTFYPPRHQNPPQTPVNRNNSPQFISPYFHPSQLQQLQQAQGQYYGQTPLEQEDDPTYFMGQQQYGLQPPPGQGHYGGQQSPQGQFPPGQYPPGRLPPGQRPPGPNQPHKPPKK